MRLTRSRLVCTITVTVSLAVLGVTTSGCGQETNSAQLPSSAADAVNTPAKTTTAPPSGPSGVTSAEPASEKDAANTKMPRATWEQVTQLFNQAKNSGQTSAGNVSQWLQDVWESTSASGVDISKQSQEWLSAQYLKAKDAGTTSATSASEYFQFEFAKIGTWEYHIVTQDSLKEDAETVAMMNQIGSEKWECFAVNTIGNQQRLYFRRKVKRDFDSIPTRDLLRILMAVASGGLLGAGDNP